MSRPAKSPRAAYDASFYSYTDAAAARSAAVVLPVVLELLRVRSVVDFGCGRGAWLAEWKRLGASLVLGVDGDFVDRRTLLVEPHEFEARDLTGFVDLGRRFDLVQSLEVAEHLPPRSSEAFVRTLAAHGDAVLFSAAPPGQGGLHHLNERPYDYWREQFERRGFVMLDWIRPAIAEDRRAAPWYRYNTFAYVRDSVYETLDSRARASRLAEGRPVPDVSPAVYRIRKAVLRRLPRAIVDRMTRVKMAWSGRRPGPT